MLIQANLMSVYQRRLAVKIPSDTLNDGNSENNRSPGRLPAPRPFSEFDVPFGGTVAN